MLVSIGAGASVRPKGAEAAGANTSPPRRRATRPTLRERHRVAVRGSVLAALALAYWGSFGTLHGVLGNPAFLGGLGICVLAGAWLGLRGAVVVILAVVLVARIPALRPPARPGPGR